MDPPEASTLAGLTVGSRGTMGAPLLDSTRNRRLAELGLRAGVDVVVLCRTAGGGRVIAVGDGRIALDRATLLGLPVRQAPPDDQGTGIGRD
jgi:ferrous iron transport protein A